MSRRKRYAIVSLLAAVIALLAVWFLKPIGREFDAELWKDQAQVRSGVRQRMADRLIARQSLLGMSRDEVVAMLGPFEERSSDVRIVYDLGPERGFISMDGELFIVELDEYGKVSRCRIITT